MNEIWASSTFLYDTYRKCTEKLIAHIPLNVHIPSPTKPDGIGSVLGSKFTFICVFDFNSRIERKNPMGAIAAFRAAFPKTKENVQLLLKTIHADSQPKYFNAIREAIGDDDRIVLIDCPVSRAEICWLIQNSDAYLSLHRSEGFGRPIAEAMLLGTPVIGTGWSGCADFLNEDTGFPIAYTLRPLEPGEYPFAAGEWAEPDIGHAADVMRRIYAQGGADQRITSQARETVTRLFSRQSICTKLVERLRTIGEFVTSDENLDRLGLAAEKHDRRHGASSIVLPVADNPQLMLSDSRTVVLTFK